MFAAKNSRMDSGTRRALGLAAAFAASCASTAVSAAVLYKSIGPNGVTEFSDRPPETGRIVAAIPLDSTNNVPALVTSEPDPSAAPSATDAAVERASAKVDLAEHALAEARRPVWTQPDVLRIGTPRMTRADRDRIDWYQKDLHKARLALADAMRRKLKAETAVTLTASNDWQPVRPGDRR